MSSRELSYAEALNEALKEEMTRDSNVFIIGLDIAFGGIFGVTKGLLDEFGPSRVLSTPLSEGAFTGCALGAAVTGMRPVVEIMYMDFITMAMDAIINQIAKFKYMLGGKARVPIVIRTASGAQGSFAAQHSQSLESLFFNIPGLYIAVPSTPYDAKGMLKAAIRDDNPVLFMEHKALYSQKGLVPEEEYIVPLGRADVVKSGKDITIIATSRMVHTVLQATTILEEKHNISIEVIDLRCLCPLDMELIINSVKKTHRAIVVHEAPKTGGFGGEIAARIFEEEFYYLDAPVVRIASVDVPMPYNQKLESMVIPSKDSIVKAAEEMISKKT